MAFFVVATPMPVLTSQVRLTDEAAVQRQRRHAALTWWARGVVLGIVDLVVDISENPSAAAQRDQEEELRLDLATAGLSGEIPLHFGKPDPWAVDPVGLACSSKASASSRRRRQHKESRSQRAKVKKEKPVLQSENGGEASKFVVNPGDECLSFYPGDGLWYRAVVETVESNDDQDQVCCVSLIGYDLKQTVPMSWLHPVPDAVNSGATTGASKGASEPLISSETGAGESPLEILDRVDTTGASEPLISAEPEAGESSPEVVHPVSETLKHMATTSAAESACGPLLLCEPGSGVDTGESPAPETAPDVQRDTKNPQSVQKRRRNKGGGRSKIANWSAEDSPNPFHGSVDDKYWAQRFRMFSLFDHGVKLDSESWYSVTPEIISKHMAERLCRCGGVVFDPFCGVGGNAIEMARTCRQVVAMDIDPSKIAMARHNAEIYGVRDRIEFIVGDALATLRSMPSGAVDTILLSPPWGGPSYLSAQEYDIKTMLSVGDSCDVEKNCDGEELFGLARRVTQNVAYFLPRNISAEQLGSLAANGEACEVEDQILNNKLKTRVAYYGSLVGDGEA